MLFNDLQNMITSSRYGRQISSLRSLIVPCTVARPMEHLSNRMECVAIQKGLRGIRTWSINYYYYYLLLLLLWDFTIQTDRMIGARRPDITIVNKETRECQLIDIACPGDNKVAEKEDEKIDKYRDLAREVSKLWNVKVAIIPVVIGALGTVPTMLESRIKEIGISIKTAQIQKTVLLGTARILRKVLEF